MANAQTGGLHVLVDAEADTAARVGGMALLVDAEADTVARVGGLYLLVDAQPSTGLPFSLMQGSGFGFQRGAPALRGVR